MKDFKDKVLVVTGAGFGIGRAIAIEGAQRGMKVVINDICGETLAETKKMIEDIGAPVVAFEADISLSENVKKLLDITLENFGKVNICCANAGVTLPGPIWETPIKDIDWIVDCNFTSHTYAMHYFIKQMIEQGDECAFMNTASGAGLMVSASSCMYHATKNADVIQTEATYLAMKIRGITNVQMHVLCPAFIKTEIHLSDKHRPERYAIDDDPYYQSDEYIAGCIRAAAGVATGIPVDSVGMTVFQGFEDNKFYILTHPEAAYGMVPRTQAILSGKHPG